MNPIAVIFADAVADNRLPPPSPVQAGGSVLIYLIGGAMVLVLMAFPVWMFIDALTRPIKDRTLWALRIFFTGFVGAVVYYFAGRKKLLDTQPTVV